MPIRKDHLRHCEERFLRRSNLVLKDEIAAPAKERWRARNDIGCAFRTGTQVWLLTFLMVLLITGQVYAETPEEARLRQIKALYLMKCSKCHRLYDPKEYEDTAWADWMVKMKKKARLNDEQYEKIARYAESLRKG